MVSSEPEMDRISFVHQAKASLSRPGSHSTVASYDKKFGSFGTAGIGGGSGGGGDGQQRLSAWIPGKVSGCAQWPEVNRLIVLFIYLTTCL